MSTNDSTRPILGSEALSIAATYRAILDSDDPNDIPKPGDHHAAYRELIETIERLVATMDALDPRAAAEAEREACAAAAQAEADACEASAVSADDPQQRIGKRACERARDAIRARATS